ncbi:hypothetical protein BpHYR1_009265 [Brachionus plicatilis]|uniref:Uncharacterized protein n=1 Tax=Brachionus plicatilis TaxID=10195 RepID=A0A3M7Q7F3_BRAPC|nr:hypothetical protein BpHYR1_009265 [Brachionus plicatilis]
MWLKSKCDFNFSSSQRIFYILITATSHSIHQITKPKKFRLEINRLENAILILISYILNCKPYLCKKVVIEIKIHKFCKSKSNCCPTKEIKEYLVFKTKLVYTS